MPQFYDSSLEDSVTPGQPQNPLASWLRSQIDRGADYGASHPSMGPGALNRHLGPGYAVDPAVEDARRRWAASRAIPGSLPQGPLSEGEALRSLNPYVQGG